MNHNTFFTEYLPKFYKTRPFRWIAENGLLFCVVFINNESGKKKMVKKMSVLDNVVRLSGKSLYTLSVSRSARFILFLKKRISPEGSYLCGASDAVKERKHPETIWFRDVLQAF